MDDDFDHDMYEFDQCIKICKVLEHFKIRSLFTLTFMLEGKFESGRWRHELPFISWPAEWEVKYYPSLSALLRGVVRLKNDHSRNVSFYFDGYAYLGAMYNCENKKPIPYWEIYNISIPVRSDEDCGPERFLMNEVDELLIGIGKMLNGVTLKDENNS